MSTVKLGYWGIKGAAEVSRLTLHYLGVDYEEYNPAGKEAWFAEKAGMGFDFPNLPFIQVDDFKLTESGAIPRYLALKFGKPEFLGATIEEEAVVNQLLGVFADIQKEFYKAVFSPTPEEGVKAAVADVKVLDKIARIVKFLGDNQFLVGNKFTLADLQLAQ